MFLTILILASVSVSDYLRAITIGEINWHGNVSHYGSPSESLHFMIVNLNDNLLKKIAEWKKKTIQGEMILIM